MKKVTQGELIRFLIRFYDKQYGSERLGQAFLNHIVRGVTDSELFYEEHQTTALLHINDNYTFK